MTTQEMVKACPEMDYGALETEILEGVLYDDNYLFYRSGAPFVEWPSAEEYEPNKSWELYCTHCHTAFYKPKRRGFKPSTLGRCPECGAAVEAKRWMRRAQLETRILYYKFQRGTGRDIWLRAYHVRHNFCPNPGDEHIDFYEVARYRFYDGGAEKWTCTAMFCGHAIHTNWTARKCISKTTWYVNQMDFGSEAYPAYIGVIGVETIRGSCLAYSQLDSAMEIELDIPEYLALYCKYPTVEYLWKMGIYHLIEDKLMRCCGKDFQRVVNLRAKNPRGLLRGLTKQEVRYIADNKPTCAAIADYRKLREKGIVACDPAGWTWAAAITNEIVEHCAARGMTHKELRNYIEKQAKRSRRSVPTVLGDYKDYLRQNIDELGLDTFDLAPHDLNEAHERLSARLRRAAGRKNLAAFRIRRRQLAWLRFAQGNYLIRPIDSPMELVQEGEQQHNCVASYEKRHASGQTAILVLRRRDRPHESWHTVEFNEKDFIVRQLRGIRNAEAAPEAQAFVERWLGHLHVLRGEQIERRSA